MGINTELALELIRQERLHQVDRGFDDEHDDGHPSGELIQAAKAMIYRDEYNRTRSPNTLSRAVASWPWKEDMPKQRGGQRDLIVGISLLVAELERRLRDE